MGWFSRKTKTKKAGSSTQDCPLGNLDVIISDKSDDSGVKGAKISIFGPEKKNGSTNKMGLSSFKKIQPGTYKVEIKFPKKYQKGYKTSTFSPTVSLGVGRTAELRVEATAFGNLIVIVTDDTGADVTNEVIINGPDVISKRGIKGKEKFEHVSVGKYKVKARVDKFLYSPKDSEKEVEVEAGKKTKVEFQVHRRNIITPKIECDLSPIIFFSPVAAEDITQEIELEKQKVAQPRELTYFVDYSVPDASYGGTATLRILGGAVEAYEDKDCQNKISLSANNTIEIKNSKLQHQSKTTIYLKGVSEGTFIASLILNPVDDPKIGLEPQQNIRAEVVQGNLVTPEMKAEYLAIPWDKQNHKLRPKSETPLKTQPVKLQLCVLQSNSRNGFSLGAMLKISPAYANVYSDEECTTKIDLSKPIAIAKLCGAQPYTVFLKGVSKGKFEATLKLEQESKKGVIVNKPHKLKMAVVDLNIKLFTTDVEGYKQINLNPDAGTMDEYHTQLKDLDPLPEQKELVNKDKIEKSRVLHAQIYGKDDMNHHARAKLVIEKLKAADWPEDTDEYQIYLNRTNLSGAVKVFDKEFVLIEDHAQGNPPEKAKELKFPVGPFKVSELKAADKVFWIEGSKETDKDKSVCLDLTLDRPESDIPNDPVRYADHAYFCVLKIEKVELDYKAPDGKASAYDKDKQRFFINLTGEEVKKDSDDKDDGRKIKIKAKLSQPIQGVKVYFMLAEDKDNRKEKNWGVDMPDNYQFTALALSEALKESDERDGSTQNFTQNWQWKDVNEKLKHVDKEDRKKYLHLSESTDDKGEVTIEVYLSAFNGDKFHLSAYLEEDLHLGRYIHGHDILEKRKPVMAEKPLQVWKKFWYQLVELTDLAVEGVLAAPAPYEKVRTLMAEGDKTQINKAEASGATPAVVYYPKYMIGHYYITDAAGKTTWGNNYPNNTDDALVINITKSDYENILKKVSDNKDKEPVAIPMISVHYLCEETDDNNNNIESNFTKIASLADFPIKLVLDKAILNPPLQGGDLVVSGKLTYEIPASNSSGIQQIEVAIEDAHITIPQDREEEGEINLELPQAMKDKKVPAGTPLPAGTLQDGETVPAGTTFAQDMQLANGSTLSAGDPLPADETVSATFDPPDNTRLPNDLDLPDDTPVEIELTLKGASSFLGLSTDSGIINTYTPHDTVDYVNTIVHELGHSLQQVAIPVDAIWAPTGEKYREKNPLHELGIPVHPVHYEKSGPHCSYEVDKCVMYESGPVIGGLNEFCPVCHPHVLIEPMKKMTSG